MGGGGLAGSMQMDRRFMFTKKMSSGGCLPLPRGYIHAYDHNIQTSSSQKPLSQSKPNFMWSIVRKGGMKVNINGPGQVTKMATMAINSKNLYKSFSSETEDL